MAIIAATPFFMGIAALKFKSGDMEAMGKNLGGRHAVPGPKDRGGDYHLGGEIADP